MVPRDKRDDPSTILRQSLVIITPTCPGSKCPPDRNNCCCWTILFNQPDFVSQKSELQELIEQHGHLCDFYPKYHCELNFIEQYWVLPNFASIQQEEQQPLMTWKRRYWLAWITFLLTRFIGVHRFFFLSSLHSYCVYRYANRSARFIHAYGEGLTGAQAAWANKRYHSHCTLTPDMIREVKNSILPWGNFFPFVSPINFVVKFHSEPRFVGLCNQVHNLTLGFGP